MAKKLWGARFKRRPEREFFEFQKSIYYDQKLAKYDVYHSLLHIRVLYLEGILTLEEFKSLQRYLEGVLRRIKEGSLKIDCQNEDIHTFIQNIVERNIGQVSFKLHTFRSRNEQIAFDETFYCYEQAQEIISSLEKILRSIGLLSRRYKDIPFVVYTHTQRAQTIKFSQWILSFSEKFSRDIQSLKDYLKNLKIYIGSGACAGTPLKRSSYEKAIRYFLRRYRLSLPVKIASNPLDVSGARDHILQLLFILSLIQMHLSRLSEDIILYSTKEFSLLELPEEFCTGSSLLAHKKNPDFLELIRGHTAKVYSNLLGMFVLMKSLPSTYNRDMQLDKDFLFSSVESVKSELLILPKLLFKIRPCKERIYAILDDDEIYIPRIINYLVYKKVPFRKAYDIAGKIVRFCEGHKRKIRDLTPEELKKFSSRIIFPEFKKIFSSH